MHAVPTSDIVHRGMQHILPIHEGIVHAHLLRNRGSCILSFHEFRLIFGGYTRRIIITRAVLVTRAMCKKRKEYANDEIGDRTELLLSIALIFLLSIFPVE